MRRNKLLVELALFTMKHPKQAKNIWKFLRKPDETELNLELYEYTAIPSKVLEKVANILFTEGKPEEALFILSSCNSVACRLMEGRLLLFLGKYDKARAIFSTLAVGSDNRVDALMYLSYMDYLGGNIKQAIELLSLIIAKYPSRVPPITLFSRIVRNEADIQDALEKKSYYAKEPFKVRSATQLIRACVRATAYSTAEKLAVDAIINLQTNNYLKKKASNKAGLPKGSFTEEKGNIVIAHLSNLMKEESVRFFPTGGTLLGLFRDSALLPWDKDLDFGCFVEDADFDKVLSIFSRSPFFLPMGTTDDKLIKFNHVTGVTVDIFINFLEGEYRRHSGQFVSWTERNFSLNKNNIGKYNLYFPDNPEEYLRNHYGEGWKDPDPLFDVFWEAPNICKINKDKRRTNTIAKAIDLLAMGSISHFNSRMERAKQGGASDVFEGYQFVKQIYNQYSSGMKM